MKTLVQTFTPEELGNALAHHILKEQGVQFQGQHRTTVGIFTRGNAITSMSVTVELLGDPADEPIPYRLTPPPTVPAIARS